MTITAHWYGLALKHIANKEIDLDSDTIKCALVDSGYTPNLDTDEFWATPQAHEITGTNYTAGGLTLGAPSLVYDAATNQMQFKASDASWSNATLTCRHAVIYDATPGAPASDFLICYVDLGQDYSATAHEFRISWVGGVVGYIEVL